MEIELIFLEYDSWKIRRT